MQYLTKVYCGIIYHTIYIILSYGPGLVRILVWLRPACTFSTQDLSSGLASVLHKVTPSLPFAHFFFCHCCLHPHLSLPEWTGSIGRSGVRWRLITLSVIAIWGESYSAAAEWEREKERDRECSEWERSPRLLLRVVWPDSEDRQVYTALHKSIYIYIYIKYPPWTFLHIVVLQSGIKVDLIGIINITHKIANNIEDGEWM